MRIELRRRKKDARRLTDKDAYTSDGKPGLTTARVFLGKARRMAWQDQRHEEERKVRKVRIGPIKMKFATKIGVPLGMLEIGLSMRDLYQAKKLKDMLIEKPRIAAVLEAEFKGTRAEPFFSGAAEAARNLQRKESGRPAIEMIAERRRGLQAAEKKWFGKGGKPEDLKDGRRKGIRKPGKESERKKQIMADLRQRQGKPKEKIE